MHLWNFMKFAEFVFYGAKLNGTQRISAIKYSIGLVETAPSGPRMISPATPPKIATPPTSQRARMGAATICENTQHFEFGNHASLVACSWLVNSCKIVLSQTKKKTGLRSPQIATDIFCVQVGRLEFSLILFVFSGLRLKHRAKKKKRNPSTQQRRIGFNLTCP